MMFEHWQVSRMQSRGDGPVVVHSTSGRTARVNVESMAALLAQPSKEIRRLVDAAIEAEPIDASGKLIALADRQELWAAGVTYERSREARVAESGQVDIYTSIYTSDRPELFLKSTPERVVAPGDAGRLREDSTWDACEPELVAVANAEGEVVGFTIGNDLCSRSIEAENPLYLPQAKVYTDCCLLASGWTPTWRWALRPERRVTMRLFRNRRQYWEGSVTLSQLRRDPQDLVDWLFRELSFPNGVFLFTGTGIVAPDDVRLQPGDDVEIEIDGLGVLRHGLYRRHRAPALVTS